MPRFRKLVDSSPPQFVMLMWFHILNHCTIEANLEIEANPMSLTAFMHPMHVAISKEFILQRFGAVFFLDFLVERSYN